MKTVHEEIEIYIRITLTVIDRLPDFIFLFNDMSLFNYNSLTNTNFNMRHIAETTRATATNSAVIPHEIPRIRLINCKSTKAKPLAMI